MRLYSEKSNGNKYMALVPTDESKAIMKKYEEEIRDQIRTISNNSDNYDENYMKIKLNFGW